MVSVRSSNLRIRSEVSNYLQFTAEQTPIRMLALENGTRSETPAAAIVLLHGAGGDVDFWASQFGSLLSSAGIALYAPRYFDSTGTTRADLDTINDGVHVPKWLKVVEASARFVATRPTVDPDRVVFAGISLGAFLSLAFAAQQSAGTQPGEARCPRALIDVSGGLVAPFAAMATARFPPTLILHGAKDAVVSVNYAHALDQKLTELDVAHRTEIFADDGHWFSGASLPRMLLAISNFLEEHLSVSQAGSPAM